MYMTEEIIEFIEEGLRRDMTDHDIIEWCEDNTPDLADIYHKYVDTNLSYRMASMTMFFIESVYGCDDDYDKIRLFVNHMQREESVVN